MKVPFWFTWKPTLFSAVGVIVGGVIHPAAGAAFVFLTGALALMCLIGGLIWRRKHKAEIALAASQAPAGGGLLRPCKACGAQFSKQIDHCPQCGHDNASKWVHIVAFVMAGILVFYYKGGGYERDFNSKVQKNVVSESLAHYDLTEKHGTAVELCMGAGEVAEAYKMAGDESAYADWQKIKQAKCRKAGM